jgi:hypothetical protein
MATAPMLAAVLTEVPRSASVAEFASTRRILQSGHPALTMSRSSEISPAHPELACGSDVVEPVWPTFAKQPLAEVHAGRP